MGESRLGESVNQSNRGLGDELTRALNLLRAEMLTPPLSFVSEPEPLHPKAPAAISAGSGPALQPEYIELAHYVRGDWESSLRSLQVAVGRVCEVAGADDLAVTFSRFKSILQRLAAVVRQHDHGVEIMVGGYRRNGPPQEGGPFLWKEDVVGSAKRAWLFKTQGPDVLGTTFVHYGGSPRKDLREAWQALSSASEGVQAQVIDLVEQAAGRAVQRGVEALNSTGGLPPLPKTAKDREAFALNLITVHGYTSLTPLADECKRLGCTGMSKTSLSKYDKIKKALALAKSSRVEKRTTDERDASGRPMKAPYLLEQQDDS